jgi:Mn-containing catalase
MFSHNKRLQYTVRVNGSNPGLANLLLEQFGGPQGELAAACRYFTQALGEDDPGRKDMLFDIATEELSHLEIIGTIVGMLNKGAKGRLAEGVEKEGELYRSITGAGNDSHITQVLYGGGPPLVNSAGVPWTAAYIDTIGEPTADLRSNIAAESRAKIVYERLINLTTDPGVKDALTFLMTREIAHQKSFEKALYAIEPNFPAGKLPGDPRFTSVYYRTPRRARRRTAAPGTRARSGNSFPCRRTPRRSTAAMASPWSRWPTRKPRCSSRWLRAPCPTRPATR